MGKSHIGWSPIRHIFNVENDDCRLSQRKRERKIRANESVIVVTHSPFCINEQAFALLLSLSLPLSQTHTTILPLTRCLYLLEGPLRSFVAFPSPYSVP